MKKLETQIIRACSIQESLSREMYALYEHYYAETNYPLFLNDLKEKDIVLLLFDVFKKLRGFTTLRIINTTFQGKETRAIFSGDTIIHHEFWGEQTLPFAWCQLVGQIKAESPEISLYWFLIVKGHRTYRYLNIFSKKYYPNRKSETPLEVKALMDHLANQKFGSLYNSSSGLIEYEKSHGHLRQEWSNSELAKSPEAQFFNERNPDHSQGNELVCITELCEENLRSFALKGFQTGLAYGKLELD